LGKNHPPNPTIGKEEIGSTKPDRELPTKVSTESERMRMGNNPPRKSFRAQKGREGTPNEANNLAKEI